MPRYDRDGNPLESVLSKRLAMKTIYKSILPSCDICQADSLLVAYDMPYREGHWANVCETCRQKADQPETRVGFKVVKGKHPKAGLSHGNDSRSIKQIERDHATALNQTEVEELAFDDVVTTADGCSVEPDGKCPHGFRSPLLVLGLI